MSGPGALGYIIKDCGAPHSHGAVAEPQRVLFWNGRMAGLISSTWTWTEKGIHCRKVATDHHAPSIIHNDSTESPGNRQQEFKLEDTRFRNKYKLSSLRKNPDQHVQHMCSTKKDSSSRSSLDFQDRHGAAEPP